MNKATALLVVFGFFLVHILSGGKASAAQASEVFPLHEVEAHLQQALQDEMAQDTVGVRYVRFVTSMQDRQYTLAQLMAAGLTQADISLATVMVEEDGTFRAQLDVHTEDARILQALQGTHLAAIGKYEEMIAVPTVRNRIERGQIIAQGDLDWVTMPRRRVNGDMVLEPESLLSMQAARSLVPGRPVRSSDVTEPVMVERGATVTMTFATQNMELRALGEAMEDGKKGEVIKVRNTESGKVVFAKVEGPSMLKVNFMPKLAQKSARQQTAMQ